ncbi:hypothetical protein [Actinomadura yumaensis]|uniref:PH domain-containing protein n=1 Tax=Actinomadura yumaensis TaxID=111807 RepID=A0ABW2CFT9_9ACTN
MPNADNRGKTRRPGPEAFQIAIKRIPRERRRELSRRSWRRMSRTQWIIASPFLLLVAFVMLGLTICPPLYALFGTDVPGMVNAAGNKGPAPTSERVTAVVIWVPWMAFFGFAVWRNVRVRLLAPCLAVDPEGLWPVFGGRVQGGLEWKRLAAVGFADGRHVELFPVDPIKDAPHPTLLDGLVVNGRPPARGLRGKRYVVELADDVEPSELNALREAIARFGGPGKILVPEGPRS